MNKSDNSSVYDESIVYAFYKTLRSPIMRPVVIKCIATIVNNFFLRQYRAALMPGRVPVSKADHPLDEKIPFNPSWVTIYLDFVTFWVRMVSYLLRSYGRRAHNAVTNFISTMGKLYEYAADVYRRNFSTTKRPFYIARPRFFLIHLVDPHLMCIPSLHVMIAIRTYTQFTRIMRGLNEDKKRAAQIEEMRQGALAISRAILYVKQHSVNCVSAALYAMCRFDPDHFTPEEAEAFAVELFSGKPPAANPGQKKASNYAVRPAAAPLGTIKTEHAAEIQEHVIRLFRRFMSDNSGTEYWGAPLLQFLREMPVVEK